MATSRPPPRQAPWMAATTGFVDFSTLKFKVASLMLGQAWVYGIWSVDFIPQRRGPGSLLKEQWPLLQSCIAPASDKRTKSQNVFFGTGSMSSSLGHKTHQSRASTHQISIYPRHGHKCGFCISQYEGLTQLPSIFSTISWPCRDNTQQPGQIV